MTTSETGMAERYQRARGLFEHGEFQAAAEELSQLVDTSAFEPPLHGTTELRLLLARSYFHSAQLRRAETVTRAILVDDPDEAYANLLLGRTLERQGRAAEAKPHLVMAELLGGYGDEGRLPPAVRDEGVGGVVDVEPPDGGGADGERPGDDEPHADRP
ncbi:tetratricopeptide repeat protein [Arthrobacter sp. NEB 688]|uniref:tetratricopeptide repeat protein n=1 Tax=Arthrobacter sp. NEB 688 TaxID=904039 RepID=UPI001566AAF8|nr:tetratricopeptide repeat protein [Arthrobacter sp. NEB 688]QKE83046.1 tetratricopeptide repeat protein [Arthrobacter sp. NEB 688]